MFALWTGPYHAPSVWPSTATSPREGWPGLMPMARLSELCQLLSQLPAGRNELIRKDIHAFLHVSTYGDTHLQTYTCVHLSLSESYLFPSIAVPGVLWLLSKAGALCGSPGQDPGGRGGQHGYPLESLAGSQTGGLYQAAPPRPGKPFPRKSPLRCDRNLAGRRGTRPTGLSPRNLSGWKVRVYQLGCTT